MSIERKIEWSLEVIQAAIEKHQPSHVFGLFSGGHDSLCSTGIASLHEAFTGAVHINTGIGIEQTRHFVRDTCAARGWALKEYHPTGKTYEELVLEKGFPSGPKSHNSMYYWLKQRSVRRLVAEHKTGRTDRVGLVTGIRVEESSRRMHSSISVPVRREGGQLWINPILGWSKRDCHDFIEYMGLRRNEVVDLCHRSGECLCGALAREEELAEIELWYPDAVAPIRDLEQRAREAGLDGHVWARRARGRQPKEQLRMNLEMCSSCVQAEAAG